MTSFKRFAIALLALLAWVTASAPALAQTVTYIHTDPAGTPVMATDSNGNVVWKETYKPYGEEQANPPAVPAGHLGFTGKPFDDATGLGYFGSRYYDPVLGRFMGVDPAPPDPNNLHSLNVYAYGNNNPYRYLDPDGRNAVAAFAVPPLLIGGAWWLTRSPEQRERMIRDVSRAVSWVRGLVFNEAEGTHSSAAATKPVPNSASTPPEGPGDEDKPKRVTNPKHHQNSQSPEPKNVDHLYENSVADKSGVRWAKDSDGTVHRFSRPSNGQSHWNGSTGGADPIQPQNIPVEIRRLLGVKG